MKYNRILFILILIGSLLKHTAMYAAPSPWERAGGEASSLLSQIEENNTTLIALRTETEARKLENRTGITLADPEVGVKRMW